MIPFNDKMFEDLKYNGWELLVNTKLDIAPFYVCGDKFYGKFSDEQIVSVRLATSLEKKWIDEKDQENCLAVFFKNKMNVCFMNCKYISYYCPECGFGRNLANIDTEAFVNYPRCYECGYKY